MSKKRKTRKQKEAAVKRHEIEKSEMNTFVYAFEKKSVESKIILSAPKQQINIAAAQKSYLSQDIRKIAIAAGFILAFDILLFALLSRGVIRFPWFGY